MKLYISSLAFAVLSFSAHGQALYSVSGKTYELKDLSPAQQQQFFEIQFESYEKTRQSVDSVLLENYFDEEAKKQKKTKEEVSNKLLEVKEPSDKEVKKWYDENKAKIPPNYQFDQIKGEIAKIVKQERTNTKRTELLDKIKKDGKFSLTLSKPVAPVLDVKAEGFPTKGKEGAKVSIVEFADYQCPHCKSAADTLKKITDKMKDKVRFTFIDFPINPSGISREVAEVSHCAAEQGKFWEFHYKAFESQETLAKGSGEKIAKDLKLDEGKLKACMDAGKGKAMVDKGRAEGDRIGVSGTPFVLINGHRYVGAHTLEALTKEIEGYLK